MGKRQTRKKVQCVTDCQPLVVEMPCNDMNEANGYWTEIAALCIEDETLRIQEMLLKRATNVRMRKSTNTADEENKRRYLVNMLTS